MAAQSLTTPCVLPSPDGVDGIDAMAMMPCQPNRQPCLLPTFHGLGRHVDGRMAEVAHLGMGGFRQPDRMCFRRGRMAEVAYLGVAG